MWFGVFATMWGLLPAATIRIASTQANSPLCNSPGSTHAYCGSQPGQTNASAAPIAASSFFSRDYIFSGDGPGTGILCYDVALEGSHSGLPAGSRVEVRYNGNPYPVGGSSIAVYSFQQSFEYGAPFQIRMSVDARNSGGESGTTSVSARLLAMSVQEDPSYVPEPSAALMWLGGLLLMGYGLQRPRTKR